MPATVIINRATGLGPTLNDISNANTVVNITDSHQSVAIGSNNPIPIPVSGVSNSFWCSTRLQCTVAPSGVINNIRWYTDGANNFGTGITCIGDSASSYSQATGSNIVAPYGTPLNQTNYPSLASVTPGSVFAFTSVSPKSITGSTSLTGEFGHYFVYQMVVATTASPGATNQETFTWAYDET